MERVQKEQEGEAEQEVEDASENEMNEKEKSSDKINNVDKEGKRISVWFENLSHLWIMSGKLAST